MEEQDAPEAQAKKTSSFRVIPAVLGVAVLLATLFTAWTPAGLFSGSFNDKLNVILTSQPEVDDVRSTAYPQMRIGIVAGHWGYDSGAVCRDGNGEVIQTEVEVNLKIATLVQQMLTERGYQVDLLEEFDTRLDGYNAVALISIHNDSCEYIDKNATGFKVAAAMDTHDYNRATRLTNCLRDRYGRVTGLPFHSGSITADMREYHAFSEISDSTIAAIIETGFMNLDHDLITNQPELVASGIVQSVECFVNNESIEPAPIPTFEP